MLKLGICTPAQDTPIQRLWRRGLLSASLLAAGSERFERLMPQICLSSGVARTTSRRRFADLDASVQNLLRGLFPPGSPLRVEDWAVSSGITAAEWFLRLRAGYPGAQFTASDWTLYLIEARLDQTREIYILEPGGTPIQYIRPPFVINLVLASHWLYPVNRWLRRRALSQWKKSLACALRIPSEWEDLEGSWSPVTAPPFILRRLPLIHPEAMALRGPAFRIRRHSVFTPLDTPADIIRTMNILNRAYFSDRQLGEAVSAVGRSLNPGGLWIVGRNTEKPPRLDATIYRKAADHWEILLRLGEGSELEPLVGSLCSKAS